MQHRSVRDKEQAYKDLVRGRKRGFVAFVLRMLLRLASLPYSLVVRIRNLTFDLGLRKPFRSAVPVISIGNVTVGGTGKTPIVEMIARWCRKEELRVTILSRGYGASDGPNDEALLLEENLPDVPHLQGAKRAELAKIAVEELESEVLILDDGMQHRQLARDVEISLIDATDPFGGGWLLPGGLLREPTSSLRRANVIVITRINAVLPEVVAPIQSRLKRIAPQTPIITTKFVPTQFLREGEPAIPVAELRGKRVVSFCGIGNPDSFEKMIESLGANVADRRTFPDHYSYERKDVVDLAAWIRQSAPDVVLTTQKDAVKLRLSSIGDVPLWALRIETVIEQGESILDELLREGLSTRGHSAR
ncbi:tetraacyldisaccharide 4'-kinase [bacterium]|nr:tetraacyldisaccharide 4'-kinase [bacterium]